MIVKEGKKGYIPIEITLETRAEAKKLRSIVDCALSKSLAKYCNENGLDEDELDDFNEEMWKKIDHILRDC